MFELIRELMDIHHPTKFGQNQIVSILARAPRLKCLHRTPHARRPNAMTLAHMGQGPGQLKMHTWYLVKVLQNRISKLSN